VKTHRLHFPLKGYRLSEQSCSPRKSSSQRTGQAKATGYEARLSPLLPRSLTPGNQLLFPFLDPSFYSIPNSTIGTFPHQGLFQSLNLSPDSRHVSS
jgi:hypothetical protein